MKKYVIIVALIAATVGCSLNAQTVSQNNTDPRPIIQEDRPTLVLLAPQAENRYAQGREILLHAEAYDPAGQLARVEFYDNFDNIIGTVNSENPLGSSEITAIVGWTPQDVQRHFVKARAFRVDGTQSNLQETSIEVVAIDLPTRIPITPTATIEATAAVSATLEPAATQAPTATATTDPAALLQVRLNAVVNGTATLNVRVSPTTNAAIASVLMQGAQLELVGRSTDGAWYATPLPDGSYGWVFGQYLQIQGDSATLPLVQ